MKGKPRNFGPGIVTASVVIGPGSIVAASKAGGHHGYDLVWVFAVSAVFMGAFAAMAARVGGASERSILATAAAKFGRPVAALVGVSSFFVVAGFQFGNNVGVATALTGLTGLPPALFPPLFTALALAALYGLRALYSPLERAMKALVGAMLVAFLANLAFGGFDPVGFARGFVPSLPAGSAPLSRAMLATTFSVVAALYQARLVQERRRAGGGGDPTADALVGVGVLCLTSLTILAGAAGAFREARAGGEPIRLETAGELAASLESLFGPGAKIVFCFGLAAAAISSFLVNALIGGGLLADGLGLDPRIDGKPVKAFTAAAMAIGMGVATAVLAAGANPAASIVAAQASTLLAVPVCAVVLILLANDRSLGESRNGPALNAIGAVALAALAWTTWGTAQGLWERFFGG